jgi:hypothetical protein
MPTTTRLDGTYAPCAGNNHHDSGEIVKCDGCRAQVAKREDGKLFDVREFGTYFARKYTCWNMAHTCDPAVAAQVAGENSIAIAEGQIVKGATVTVVRGRKVPKGTTGVVFWVGTDSYDKPKIGIRDDAGVTHWTATANVEAQNFG